MNKTLIALALSTAILAACDKAPAPAAKPAAPAASAPVAAPAADAKKDDAKK